MQQELVDSELPETGHGFDYDMIVIGGGSGGLALSKEVAAFGKKVALLDFVVPSPSGSKWGLGGTCVNVGCIPKKLMHTAALLGEGIKDSVEYGWHVNVERHEWEKMVENVQDYIGSLNFGYRTQLRSKSVNYLNAYGCFLDPHTLQLTNNKKEVTKATARRIVIATGGRPLALEIPGGEHSISSDDIFSMSSPPGKTLIIGASYVALECAGFLASLGYDSTVMARSILLRGFDQQMAEMAGAHMANHGVKFIRPALPTRIEKLASGKLKVWWKTTNDNAEASDEFDTVFTAIGRKAETWKIGLDKAGVKTDSSGKIPVQFERTNVPHIYAIGDIISGGLELTPVAIQAGRMLARRLYGGSKAQMDYINVPTTIFTPLEYSACGYSEEDAIKKYGDANIEVYHSYLKPLEWNLPHRDDNVCYCKMITLTPENDRVVGVHILSPNSGEIMQGLAIAMKAGATLAHFQDTIGIHPTIAEDFTTLSVTKRSGLSVEKSGC